MVIFPLAPDQTIAQMWSNGARGAYSKSNQIKFLFNKRTTRPLSLQYTHHITSSSLFGMHASQYSVNTINSTKTILHRVRGDCRWNGPTMPPAQTMLANSHWMTSLSHTTVNLFAVLTGHDTALRPSPEPQPVSSQQDVRCVCDVCQQYSVSQKKSPLRFSEIFSQTVGNF